MSSADSERGPDAHPQPEPVQQWTEEEAKAPAGPPDDTGEPAATSGGDPPIQPAAGPAPTPELPPARPRPASDPSHTMLADILAELRKLTSRGQYEEFSIWSLFAGLAQVLVFLALFLWYLGGDTGRLHYLMLAVVLQLMALTFFSAGKS